MTFLDGTPAENHAVTAALFSERVRGVPEGRWEDPAPVAGWVARDVVRHLLEWFPGFLEGHAGIRLPDVPSLDDDPVAAWTARCQAVQGLLDDPASSERLVSTSFMGEVPLGVLVDRFYTADVFMHTWDLARATGQDETLDEATCRALLEGMEPHEEMIRGSGQYGPRVDVPPSADWQTRLLGFIGRQP